MDHEINALIRLDAWLEHGEGGCVPLDLLRQKGFEVPESLTYYADDEERQRWKTEFE